MMHFRNLTNGACSVLRSFLEAQSSIPYSGKIWRGI